MSVSNAAPAERTAPADNALKAAFGFSTAVKTRPDLKSSYSGNVYVGDWKTLKPAVSSSFSWPLSGMPDFSVTKSRTILQVKE